jgi:hypothetical protein
VVVHKANAQQVADQLPAEGRQQFIYVFGREWLSDPDGHLRTALRADYDSCPGTQVRGIEILCFRKRGA